MFVRQVSGHNGCVLAVWRTGFRVMDTKGQVNVWRGTGIAAHQGYVSEALM